MSDINQRLRQKLCDLENHIQRRILNARQVQLSRFAEIVEETPADTIYYVDKISEDAILEWFESQWPDEEPVRIVMEGLDDGDTLCFPQGATADSAKWVCILDPIDGTRNLMYDKRSAWVLGAIAPNRGADTCLADITIAALTELPCSKQALADQISGIRGEGKKGIVAERINLNDDSHTPLALNPSGASDLLNGFSSLVLFFPEGKGLTASLVEELYHELYGLGKTAAPLIFDDQYLTTGGQVYEIMVGHDRMLGDIRPLVFNKLGFESALVCHPYDICCAFLLEELGGIISKPDGSPLDAPLDTTSPVAWVGYANQTLAQQIHPVLLQQIEKHLK